MSSHKRRRIAYSQNFLKFPSLARRIVRQSSIRHDDVVLEIGPGKGILTRELARVASRVIAVEKDPRLAHQVSERLAPRRNVEIVESDFVDYPLPDGRYKVFASIPFNVTAAIVDRLTSAENPPVDSYLLVQREAAERFIGEPKTTLVSVLLAPWYEMEILHRFRRSDFAPPPRVDTVLLRVQLRDAPLVRERDAAEFKDFVARGFTAWQPHIRSAFRRVFRLRDWGEIETSGLDPDVTPSQMPVGDWLRLFGHYVRRVPEVRRYQVRGEYRRLQAQQRRLTKSHRTRSGWQ